jgi:hypothetical protein
MSFFPGSEQLELAPGHRIHFQVGTATVTAPLSRTPTSQARLYRTADPRWLVRVLPAAAATTEARSLALMRQAGTLGVNVPLVLATRVTAQHVFELMEYLPGPTYLEWAARQGTAGSKLRPLLILARSLAALHRAGIVHCDIKAEHLVMSGQVIVLLDWGVATERWGSLIGCTHAWAPQRVIRGRMARALLDCVGLSLVATLALLNLADPREVRRARASRLFQDRFRPCRTASQLARLLAQLMAEDIRIAPGAQDGRFE